MQTSTKTEAKPRHLVSHKNYQPGAFELNSRLFGFHGNGHKFVFWGNLEGFYKNFELKFVESRKHFG